MLLQGRNTDEASGSDDVVPETPPPKFQLSRTSAEAETSQEDGVS
jgi:hypothetical protein